MTTAATNAIILLQERLQLISIVNGYNTDLLGVYRGRAALEIATTMESGNGSMPIAKPAIRLFSVSDKRTEMSNDNDVSQVFYRKLVIDVLIPVTIDAYDELIDGLLFDIRRVVHNQHVSESTPLFISLDDEALFQQPVTNLCSFQIMATVGYVNDYSN